MKLDEIAHEIYLYLKKFENDAAINVRNPNYHIYPYWMPNAYAGKKKVYVTYVSYQGPSDLTKEEAIKYLEWLRDGNVGRHFEAFREMKLSEKWR